MLNGENPPVTNVFIIAASPILRAGLEAILQRDERLFAAGGAGSITPAPLYLSPEKTIDVLLVSVESKRELDDLTGFLSDGAAAADDAAAASSEEERTSPIVVALVSPEFQNPSQIVRLLQNGVRGILTSDAGAGEIRAGLLAASDLIVLPPKLLDALISDETSEKMSFREETASDQFAESLTARELEVLELLAQGDSNKRIAWHLNISEHTVKFHVASVFAKLGVNTRTEAVTEGLRRGLILL